MNKLTDLNEIKENDEIIQKEIDSILRNSNCGNLIIQVLEYDSDMHIDDIIQNISDSNVDIYTRDLLTWFSTNSNYIYVDDVVAEWGIDTTNFDMIKLIMSAQYFKNQKDMQDGNIENMLKIVLLEYCKLNGIKTPWSGTNRWQLKLKGKGMGGIFIGNPPFLPGGKNIKKNLWYLHINMSWEFDEFIKK